jgi:hypothetical protein
MFFQYRGRMPYLVNAAYCKEMTDWNVLIRLLRDDDLQHRNNLLSTECVLLAEFTAYVIHRACTGDALPSNPQKKVKRETNKVDRAKRMHCVRNERAIAITLVVRRL